MFEGSWGYSNSSDGKTLQHNGTIIRVKGCECIWDKLKEKIRRANQWQRDRGMFIVLEPILQEDWSDW